MRPQVTIDAYTLKVIKGPQYEKEFPIRKKAIHIGSAYPQNDLVLNMEGISAQHARIWSQKKKFYIQNISEDYLIFINGNRVEKKENAELDANSIIDLGNVGFQFKPDTLQNTSTKVAGNGGSVDKGIKDLIKRSFMAWRNLSQSRRMLFAVGVLLVVFLLFIQTLNISRDDSSSPTESQSEAPSPEDLSATPIALPAEEIYGYTFNNDKSHPDKVIFTFKTNSTNVDLYYTAGAIESEREVMLSLNGGLIGYAPMAEGEWGEETTLRLPKEHLIKNTENRLVFDNTMNPPEKDMWAVRNIRTKILPPDLCDMAKARKYFDLGEKLYVEKAVSKGNLYLSCQYYQDALRHMQGCDEKMDILHQADRKIKMLQTDIDKTYNDLMFNFKKAVKAKDYMHGRSILKDIIQYIPDQSDGRHKKAAKALEVFNEALGLTED